jgi:hypothetical protein
MVYNESHLNSTFLVEAVKGASVVPLLFIPLFQMVPNGKTWMLKLVPQCLVRTAQHVSSNNVVMKNGHVRPPLGPVFHTLADTFWHDCRTGCFKLSGSDT